jgi:hypothetical protein
VAAKAAGIAGPATRAAPRARELEFWRKVRRFIAVKKIKIKGDPESRIAFRESNQLEKQV